MDVTLTREKVLICCSICPRSCCRCLTRAGRAGGDYYWLQGGCTVSGALRRRSFSARIKIPRRRVGAVEGNRIARQVSQTREGCARRLAAQGMRTVPKARSYRYSAHANSVLTNFAS